MVRSEKDNCDLDDEHNDSTNVEEKPTYKEAVKAFNTLTNYIESLGFLNESDCDCIIETRNRLDELKYKNLCQLKIENIFIHE